MNFLPLRSKSPRSTNESATNINQPHQQQSTHQAQLDRGTHQVSLSSFHYLYSELIQYTIQTSSTLAETESRLQEVGFRLGVKLYDLLLLRSSLPQQSTVVNHQQQHHQQHANAQQSSSTNFDSNSNANHPITLSKDVISTSSLLLHSHSHKSSLLSILQFIHTHVWRSLFGRVASALEKSSLNTSNEEYYIFDSEPITSTRVSEPKSIPKSQLNVASFIAGIIEGIIESANYQCNVTTHETPKGDKTVFIVTLIKQKQQQ